MDAYFAENPQIEEVPIKVATEGEWFAPLINFTSAITDHRADLDHADA